MGAVPVQLCRTPTREAAPPCHHPCPLTNRSIETPHPRPTLCAIQFCNFDLHLFSDSRHGPKGIRVSAALRLGGLVLLGSPQPPPSTAPPTINLQCSHGKGIHRGKAVFADSEENVAKRSFNITRQWKQQTATELVAEVMREPGLQQHRHGTRTPHSKRRPCSTTQIKHK